MADRLLSSRRSRVRHLFARRDEKPARSSSNLNVDTDNDERDTDGGARDTLHAHPMSRPAPAAAPAPSTVVLEGPLKKRLAKRPVVMHDRYCVAAYETAARDRSCVVVRSYKSRHAYHAQPEKPSSAHELQRVRDWDGKTGFHRHAHAFTMETRERKLFQCVAASAADKRQWLELLPAHAAYQRARDRRRNSMSTAGPESLAAHKPRAVSLAGGDFSVHDGVGDRSQGRDSLFRSTVSAASSDETAHGRHEAEPLDWGLCGEGEERSTAASKYDVQESDSDAEGRSDVVLLENELLGARAARQPLDADAFLFDDSGASRFGAVCVRSGRRDSDSDNGTDDAEFVDEELAARASQQEKEEKRKRRAQKLELNRDLYAEMAAARLAGMRQEARHPKKRVSHRHSRLSTSSEASDAEMLDVDQSMGGAANDEADVELLHMRQRCSSLRSLGSAKSHVKSFVGSENASSCEMNGCASGNEGEEELANEVSLPAVVSTTPVTDVKSVEADGAEAAIAEAEELRQLKRKDRAERRAKKRMMMKHKEEEEEEEEKRVALEAAELARAHREEQRAREEAKALEEHMKRDKKERRERKEKRKHENGKKYQAEAERRKVAEQKRAEEERLERERKAKKEKKKLKKKEKYTSPSERIHRKGERSVERTEESAPATQHAEAEVTNALVAVEDEAKTKARQQLLAATEPALTPSTPSPVQTEVVSLRQVLPAPAVLPASALSPAGGKDSVSAPTVTGEGAAAAAGSVAMPTYHMSPPPFVPSYLHGPQSMPAYGLAATFGAYPPFYAAPYSYGRPVGLQPALMRPNMGFVAGLSAMNSFGTAAGPMPGPSFQDPPERMIGPQLPTSEGCSAAASSAGACTPALLVSSIGKSSGPKLINLPELPDVVEF
ncbi:unnamed protein product [Hyaloperonospora brassicae]|uniref:PH domain-containing protein n=1 Tax=Hyaloperonospora brassicae TaxID=162125 RepID=A0AAV0UZK6_HYABA|nr:unnamed protein product [Hyaloperonospora brassicae]